MFSTSNDDQPVPVEVMPETYPETYEDYLEIFQDCAAKTAKDETAVDRFFENFRVMLRADRSKMLWPNTDIYTYMLETLAYSGTKDGAERAEAIVRQMEDPEIMEIAEPNRETYGKLMEAWTVRGNVDKVQEIIDQLNLTTNDNLKPNTFLYNQLLAAYHDQPDRSEEILRDMLQASAEEEEPKVDDSLDPVLRSEGSRKNTLKPDLETWTCVLRAQSSVDKMQSLLEEFHDGEPGIEAYNIWIAAVANEKGATAAEECLVKLPTSVKPSQETFELILQEGGVEQMGRLMELQQELLGASDE